jgi:hypothetical protein
MGVAGRVRRKNLAKATAPPVRRKRFEARVLLLIKILGEAAAELGGEAAIGQNKASCHDHCNSSQTAQSRLLGFPTQQERELEA